MFNKSSLNQRIAFQVWKLQDYRAGAGRSGPSKWGEVSAVLLFPLLVWKLNSLWLPEKGARIAFYLHLAPETHISATIKVITFIPRCRLPSPPHNRGSLLGGFKGLLNTGMDTQRDAIIPGGPSKQLINTDRQSFTRAKRRGAEDSAKHCGGREERRHSPVPPDTDAWLGQQLWSACVLLGVRGAGAGCVWWGFRGLASVHKVRVSGQLSVIFCLNWTLVFLRGTLKNWRCLDYQPNEIRTLASKIIFQMGSGGACL